MKVLVIGGGPAGMLSAISAAKEGNQVIIIEKNSELGKKILITGKGRCNITSSVDISEFVNYIPGNGRFLYSAFQNFTNKDIINLLEQNGVKVREERGNRVFPISDRAIDVRNSLEKEVRKRSIEVRLNSKVKEILVKDDVAYGTTLETGEEIKADKIILATGGKSYPGTGSTGDGYKMAERLGHTITKIRGSLVPLTSSEETCRDLQGLSLRNVGIQIMDIESNKKIYDDFGEMLFTHFGVSGPTVLSGSAHLLRYKNVDELLKQNKIKVLATDIHFPNSKIYLKFNKIIKKIKRIIGEEKLIELSKNNPNKIIKNKELA